MIAPSTRSPSAVAAVDVEVAERDVATARRLVAAGEPERAAEHAEAALGGYLAAWVLTRVDPGRAPATPKSDGAGPTSPRPEPRENA